MTICSSTVSLLTNEEMGRADALAVAAGVGTERLMEAAGTAVAQAVGRRFAKMPAVVLCGPGNNGGDGFVAARKLKDAGWPVRVAALGERTSYKGAALVNAKRWDGPVETLSGDVLEGAGLVIDALFGAGLSRPLEGAALHVVEKIAAAEMTSVAVDVPSGVHGDSGGVLGAAAPAALTVTFFRRKPGHLLYPGRGLCGETAVADIGTPVSVLEEIEPKAFANAPVLWLDDFPWPGAEDHKYRRGLAVVIGGTKMTGAGRLAARSALRAGAGLVMIASRPEATPIYAHYMPGVLTESIRDPVEFAALLADERRNAVLAGPGNGVGEATRENVLAALAAGKSCVLDADALTSFAGEARRLFDAIRSPCVMTPHEGEFRRLFEGIVDFGADKLTRCRAAARAAGAVVLLKGPDTVIAAPDGTAIINENAPPTLATAGAGDVLAGLITGLLAQKMEPFEAAAAAAWIHGDAAAGFGPGLIAEDLPDLVPGTLGRLSIAAGRV